MRDSLVGNKQPDPNIVDLVNKVPHREYRDGFLFNGLKEYPEGEWSTTLDSAGPLFNRNYFWTFTDKFIEKNKKKYFEINPKEVIEPWMKIKYLSPEDMGELKIVDIINEQWKQLEKVHCNTWSIYVLTDKKLQGWELLYE